MLLWLVMGGFVVIGALLMFVLKPSLKHHERSRAEKLRAVHALKSPTPSPKLSPTPSVSPVPVVVPSPSPPAVRTTPSPSPTPTKSAKPDPLNSGLDLEPAEIKYKVVFKALADVWVRYSVDKKPTMKFILRAERILVLRAKEIIRFQVSNPKAINFNYAGRGWKLGANEKTATQQESGLTLFFPTDSSEKNTDPFADSKPLPLTPPPRPTPTPRDAPPPPTPTP